MGRRGPPPKPPGRATGHRRHTVTNITTLATATPDELPAPPPGLLKSSRRCWESLWSSPVSQVIDRSSDMSRLNRWIGNVDEYTRAMKVLKTARLVKGSQGQIRLNPLISYVAMLDDQISKTEEAFGMTPLSRLRLGIALGDAHRSLQEFNAELEAAAKDDDDQRFAIVRKMYDGTE